MQDVCDIGDDADVRPRRKVRRMYLGNHMPHRIRVADVTRLQARYAATHDAFRTNTGASVFAKAITVRVCGEMLVADLSPKSLDFSNLLGHWARHPACPPSRVTSRLP